MAEFTTKQREKLAEEKEAMPDGSYPIRNRSDLKNAIQAFGRSKNPEKTKAWIKKRARELDAEDLIPESWKENVKHSEDVVLIHYGVRGMKWHIRKKQDELSDRQLLLKKQKEEQRERYKNMTTSERKQAKVEDAASNEELANDIEARKEELKQLTEKLVEAYKDVELTKRKSRLMYERAAQIISKRKIKNARIV